MKPFMEQPQFICNDNSTIWPHLWFFHENVNFEGGSPSHPCIFKAQLMPQATDSRFSVFKAKVLSWRVMGFWPFGLGLQEPFVHPRLWGLVLLGEVSIDCSSSLGPSPGWPGRNWWAVRCLRTEQRWTERAACRPCSMFSQPVPSWHHPH